MNVNDVILCFMLVWGLSLSPHHNRLLLEIRMCWVWVHPISAPAASSMARLHHTQKKKPRFLRGGIKKSSPSMNIRGIYQRGDIKPHSHTDIISKVDEKMNNDVILSSLKRKTSKAKSGACFKGNTLHTKMPAASSVSNICLGVDKCEPVFTQFHFLYFTFTLHFERNLSRLFL